MLLWFQNLLENFLPVLESSWNVIAHGNAREGKWRGNWRMEWVVSTLHTTSEHGVSSITSADAQTSAASSRLNWRPRLFKWTSPFRRKTKSCFWACAITFRHFFAVGGYWRYWLLAYQGNWLSARGVNSWKRPDSIIVGNACYLRS